jgi:hypothetical protein
MTPKDLVEIKRLLESEDGPAADAWYRWVTELIDEVERLRAENAMLRMRETFIRVGPHIDAALAEANEQARIELGT